MTATNIEPAETPLPVEPPAEDGRRSTNMRPIVLVVASLVAAFFVIGVAMVLMTVVGRSNEDVAVGEQSAVGATAAAEEPALIDELQVATSFAEAWARGDWAAMRDLASESVVDTARGVYFDWLVVEVVQPVDVGGGELLVVDSAAGSAVVYQFTFDQASDLVTIDQLSFGGDAG